MSIVLVANVRAGQVLSLQDIKSFRQMVNIHLDSAEALASQGLPVTTTMTLDLAQANPEVRVLGSSKPLQAVNHIDVANAEALKDYSTAAAKPAETSALLDADIGPAITLGSTPSAAAPAPPADAKPVKPTKPPKKAPASNPTPVPDVAKAIGDGIDIDFDTDTSPGGSLAADEDIIDLSGDQPAATPAPLEPHEVNHDPNTLMGLYQRISDVLGEDIPGSEVAADDLVSMVVILREQVEKAAEGTPLKSAITRVKSFLDANKIGRVGETPPEHRVAFAQLILKEMGR